MKPKIITVVWWSWSWKWSLANAIIKTLWKNKVSTIPHDMYYRPHATYPNHLKFKFHENEMLNFDHPDALETELLEEHLELLMKWKEVQIPKYEFWKWIRVPWEIIKPTEFVLVDWIFTLTSNKIATMATLNLYIDVDEVNLLARRLIRDWWYWGPSRWDMWSEWMWDDVLFYIKYVQDGYRKYVKPYKSRADLILDNNEWTEKWKTPKMVDIAVNYLKWKFK